MSAPAPDELRTLRDFLRYAVTRFGEAKVAFGQGSTNAYDEAVYLLLHALSLPIDRLEPFLDARLTATERANLAGLLARRIDLRIPAAYLTGEAWLGDFRFRVDERVVIPRSFIAELLPDGLAPYIEGIDAIRRALDLCTGSGCLAILLAHAFQNAKIDAVDLSADALAVAQQNVADYGLADRIALIRSDLFDALRDTYDLIVSNPPYVTATAMSELPPEFRHEPELALAGGDDGLDAVRVIIEAAPAHLNARGVLVVEVGHGKSAVEAAFPRLPFVWLTTRSSTDALFLLTADDLSA